MRIRNWGEDKELDPLTVLQIVRFDKVGRASVYLYAPAIGVSVKGEQLAALSIERLPASRLQVDDADGGAPSQKRCRRGGWLKVSGHRRWRAGG